jgi:acetoin utilization deacetylase AcuC-like enzyme
VSGGQGRWRRWRRVLRAELPVYYGSRYTLPAAGTPVDPRRGERILSYLQEVGLLARCGLRSPRRVSMRQLRRVHDDAYLESLQDPDGLTAVLGFSPPAEAHDRFLDGQRAVAGGTVRAARDAVSRKAVALNLGGGLHHASADRGQGFCAFNDVALAVAELRLGGFGGRILVADLDLHDGDGTRAIFARDPTVHTFSIHNRDLGVVEACASTSIALGTEVADDRFLACLDESLPPLLRAEPFELVFYLAGVDGAHDDPIGDWQLTAEGLRERDRRVVRWCRESAVGTGPGPAMVVLLAGGYGPRAWSYSAGLVAALLDRDLPPPAAELAPAHYRRVASLLRANELTAEPADDDWSLSEEDLLPGHATSRRFLGYYSRHGLELALERYGFLGRLRELGHRDVRLELDLPARAGQTIRLRSGDGGPLLVELRARRDRATVPGMELLSIEWLMLQDPRASFTPERPALPGQRHPGLGMVRETTAMLVLACERLKLDGVAFVPAHYHVAVQAARFFRFVDETLAARFAALRELLRDRPLAEAARLIETGRVRDRATGAPLRWEPGVMVHPVSSRLRAAGMPAEGSAQPLPRLELVPPEDD